MRRSLGGAEHYRAAGSNVYVEVDAQPLREAREGGQGGLVIAALQTGDRGLLHA